MNCVTKHFCRFTYLVRLMNCSPDNAQRSKYKTIGVIANNLIHCKSALTRLALMLIWFAINGYALFHCYVFKAIYLNIILYLLYISGQTHWCVYACIVCIFIRKCQARSFVLFIRMYSTYLSVLTSFYLQLIMNGIFFIFAPFVVCIYKHG